MTHLAQQIIDRIAAQKALGGIDVSRLKTGTTVEFTTRNSIYKVRKLDDEFVEVQGGKHFEAPTRATLVGSTWGASLLMPCWIGQEMHVEFIYWPAGLAYKRVTTSGVKDATLYLPNGVIFPLEWVAPIDNA